MLELLTWAVGGILFILSGMHVYWVFGGQTGAKAAIPSTGTDLLFKPSKIGTSIVAFLLALAAWFVLQLGGVAPFRFFHSFYSFYSYGAGLLSSLFILRSIGDFKWVGFFKRKKGTVFAKWDTVLYSPLCFLLGTAILMIMLLRTA
ncbi:hypothetical protein J2W97_004739 [Paenibacillus jamilae]|jgi:hypothetical protein|uniref:DUF3995 domain-containing protein n=1 Tax=Paenibacillus polymyxa TaxID=1406 RepID=UPI000D30BF7F|nr:DUF3995 domain-containing protein [Paenibacillus polymyxa]MDP9678685.1 hypothetical protein [Paenibacillus jamilae]MBY0024988.1 DUF3995 domain-containing protein [Paenibacillus polymyxa]MBY0058538.1 DUF3995 domain-containing protein [Paenibacillus polymyxa]MBY0073098.1 DUF3995 domain-containing protein [Paenibacillus polymyxa]MBY0082725.1 DUF3995 domain-containing protein [Paenibacillus polymyxa]